jgi:hypothetical protein
MPALQKPATAEARFRCAFARCMIFEIQKQVPLCMPLSRGCGGEMNQATLRS